MKPWQLFSMASITAMTEKFSGKYAASTSMKKIRSNPPPDLKKASRLRKKKRRAQKLARRKNRS